MEHAHKGLTASGKVKSSGYANVITWISEIGQANTNGEPDNQHGDEWDPDMEALLDSDSDSEPEEFFISIKLLFSPICFI
jgi:hypothetical protein